MKKLQLVCMILALVAAAFYILMGLNVISVPTLSTADAPAGIAYAAGACYTLGGLLILLKKRGLWIFGLVMNTLVIALFFMMYNQKPEIMLSLAGLGTKIPQLLLETGLVVLIFAGNKKFQYVK